MKFYRKILITVISIEVLFNPILTVSAQTGEAGVSLEVTGSPICNNNSLCEPSQGETTSNCPLDCPAATGGSVFIPDTAPPIVFNLLLSEITVNSAKIAWETNEPALCQLMWGKTQEYELESIIETGLYEKHADKLTNLLSGTAYHFKISCRDAAKNESETGDQILTTLFPQDILPPANISDFSAKEGDQKIDLSWKNPQDTDFKGVKIVRSTGFYPDNPNSGVVIYNGDGENFTDTAVKNGIRYYYTAFTYDKAGNYSSGAIVSGYPHKPGEIVPPIEIPTSTIPITSEIEKLNLNDFDFIQEGKKIVQKDGHFDFKEGMPLTASIVYEKVPEVLKTIMVTLTQGEKVFSFLLRINKDKTRYEASIAAPDPGIYPLTMTILDYQNQKLKTIKGELVITGEMIQKTFCQKWAAYIYIVAIIIILIIIYLIWRKRKNRGNKSKVQISNVK
jgi:hypothetical protein